MALFICRSVRKVPHLSNYRALIQIFPYSTKAPLTKVSEKDGVRKVVMCSPKTRNALSLDMLNTLHQDILSIHDKLRCIVISGEGPVFSAGHNLKELTTTEGMEHHIKVFSTCTALMLGITRLPVPVIAQISGLATAAGCQLAATCDMVVAARTATFSTPGSNFGIFCSTPGIALARAVPRKVASYMLFTGETVSAEEAYQAGLVSRLVDPEKLEEETDRICDTICCKSRPVVAIGKHFFHHQIQQKFDIALKEGEAVMVDNLALVDAQEGLKAFREKRTPVWTHTTDKAH